MTTPTATAAPTLRSTVPGVTTARTVDSVNPADLGDVVARVELAGPDAHRRGRPPGERRSAAVGRRPRARPRPGDRGDRPARRGELRGPCRSSSPARSASRSSRRAARCRRSSTPATSSSARAAASTARPCRARCRTSSCSRSACRSGRRSIITARQLPGRGAVVVPGAGAARRQRRRLEARRVRRRHRRRPRPDLRRRRRCPTGCSTVVHADGAATFEGLDRALEQGLVGKVGFTGSTDVGRRIGELCGRHLQSPCLELGGKNPMVVTADADLDLAVEGALFGGFGTAGQRCTSLGTADRRRSTCTSRSCAASTPPSRRRPGRRPHPGRRSGPAARAALRGALRDVPRLDRRPPPHARVDRRRADRRRQPPGRLRRRRRSGPLLPPGRRRRRPPGRRALPGRDVRPDRRRHDATGPSTRRSSWPTCPATASRRRSTRRTRRPRSGSGRASAPAWSA